MADFEVKPSILEREVSGFKSAQSCLKRKKQEIESVKNQISLSGASGIKVKEALEKVMGQLDRESSSTKSMYTALGQIAKNYETTEESIQGITVINKKVETTGSGKKNTNKKGETTGSGKKNTNKKGETTGNGKKDTDKKEVNKKNKTSEREKKNTEKKNTTAGNEQKDKKITTSVTTSGTGLGAEISGSAYDNEISAGGTWAGASAGVDVVTGAAGIAIGLTGAEASLGLALLTAEGEAHLGLEDMNAHVGAEGALVGADASASIGVTKKDKEYTLGAKAEAEAYLAKGEVSAGLTLFGVDIDIAAEGMVGVQAGVGAEVSTNDANVMLALGPLQGEVNVDWSDFDLTFWD